MSLSLFFSVGTDVHPFDRLVDWADSWAIEHPDDDVWVQHGTSSRPRQATGAELVGRTEMLERLGAADVVVLSCGPGAVMDARRVGRLPIVIPRRADLGEHVDGHQLTFARHLAEHGVAVLVEDHAALANAVERARNDPRSFTVDPDATEPPGIGRLGTLIDQLVLGVTQEPGPSTT